MNIERTPGNRWPVLVQDWQLECCGAAFSVGDEIEWTLSLVDAAIPVPPTCLVSLDMSRAGVATVGG